jgi:hypothetical protein
MRWTLFVVASDNVRRSAFHWPTLSPTGLYEEGQVKPEWLIRAAYCGTPAFILASMA